MTEGTTQLMNRTLLVWESREVVWEDWVGNLRVERRSKEKEMMMMKKGKMKKTRRAVRTV